MKKKFLTITLALAMLVSLLSGCMVQDYDIDLKPDGSGHLVASCLIADEVLTMMGQTEDDLNKDMPENGKAIHRTIEGVPYSGVEMSVDFANAAELEEFLSGDVAEDESTILHIVPEVRNGKNTVTMYTTVLSEEEMIEDSMPKDMQTDPSTEQTAPDGADAEAEPEGLFSFSIAITFPEGVESVLGLSEDDYTIEGKTAKIEVLSGVSTQQFSVTGVLGDAEVQPALGNLAAIREYTGGFTDVPADAWYADELARVYATGIVSGTSDTTYAPQKLLTRAHVIAMAARLRATYEGNTDVASLLAKKGSEPWYQPCLEYCIRTGILEADTFDEYTVPATRGDMARVLSRCLPEKDMAPINEAITFTDVPADHPWAESIGILYRSGITTGTSADAFSPDKDVTRAQAAVFLSRLMYPDTRSGAAVQAD